MHATSTRVACGLRLAVCRLQTVVLQGALEGALGALGNDIAADTLLLQARQNFARQSRVHQPPVRSDDLRKEQRDLETFSSRLLHLRMGRVLNRLSQTT